MSKRECKSEEKRSRELSKLVDDEFERVVATFAALDRELTEISDRLSALEERRRVAVTKVRRAIRAKSN